MALRLLSNTKVFHIDYKYQTYYFEYKLLANGEYIIKVSYGFDRPITGEMKEEIVEHFYKLYNL